MAFSVLGFPKDTRFDLLQPTRFPLQRFRMPDDKIAAVVELPAESLDELLGRCAVEVNHDIPAKNNVIQVACGIARVDKVPALKIDLLAQLLLHPVIAAPRAFAFLKVARQPCRVWQFDLPLFVDAPARLFQNPGRNIGGKDLPGILVHRLEAGGHDNGHRVGFFSRGTSRAPRAERLLTTRFKIAGNDSILEKFEMLDFAEKSREVGRQCIDQMRDLFRLLVGFQELAIFRDA